MMAHSDKDGELRKRLRLELEKSLMEVRTSWQQVGDEIRTHEGRPLEELEDYFNSLIFGISGGISVLQTLPTVRTDPVADLERMKREIALCGHIGKLLLEMCKEVLNEEPTQT